MTEYRVSFLRTSSAISSNLSSALIALIFITPNFLRESIGEALVLLISDTLLAIMFWVAGMYLDKKAYGN